MTFGSSGRVIPSSVTLSAARKYNSSGPSAPVLADGGVNCNISSCVVICQLSGYQKDKPKRCLCVFPGLRAVFAGTGTNFDSDLLLYVLEAEWKLSDRWNLSYSLTRLELDPDPELDTTLIHVFRTDYNFTPDLLVTLFLQSNSAIDKENIQALLVWRFLPPFGSLQLAYQRGTSATGERSEQGDTVFSKLAWVF